MCYKCFIREKWVSESSVFRRIATVGVGCINVFILNFNNF
jgi:hypothetical protein